MSDTNHVDAIRGMMDTILVSAAWSGASPEERTALMDHYRSIMDHADALQRERAEAREALVAERARVGRLRKYASKMLEEIGALCEPPGASYWSAMESSGEAMAHYHDRHRRVLRKGDLDVHGDLPDEGEVTT